MKVDATETATAPMNEEKESDNSGGDLYPTTSGEHQKLLDWCMKEFTAADMVREPLRIRWTRFYKMYRNYVIRRKGDWRSKVFIPIVFYVIEAIVPRMIAQLPKFIVEPIGPEDEEPAKVMERMLEWAANKSELYLELAKCYRSALKYGTGIAKVRHERREKEVWAFHDEMAQTVMPTAPTPLIDPSDGSPMMDINGTPMMDTNVADAPLGEPQPTGRRVRTSEKRLFYDGPITEFVSVFDFWPAPDATSITDARYVIQRTFRDDKYVQAKIDDGIFKVPPGMTFSDFYQGETSDVEKLREEVGDGGTDPTMHRAELLEFWTDDAVMVVLNRRAVVRCDHNPFEHGEKPFIRIVDYFQEGEFWGIGEIEPLEGLQDLENALWNQRVDNVRLVLNKMLAFDPDNIHDLRDLQIRPGGTIRVRSRDIPAREVLQAIDIPDVTSSSYTEAAEIERMTEKVSGVSAYTTGTDSPTMNQTATGVSLITEQSNTRFSLKVKMAELTGLGVIARQYGSILQQFMPQTQAIRILNDDGVKQWVSIDAESLQGGFDFFIEAESSTITESVRKEQSMSLMQTFSQMIDPLTQQPLLNLQALADDVLEAFGKTNKARYRPAPPPPPPPMAPQMGPGMGMDPSMGATMDPNAQAPPPGPDPNQIMAMMAQAQPPADQQMQQVAPQPA